MKYPLSSAEVEALLGLLSEATISLHAPVEVTGLLSLLDQANVSLREYGPCDCHGSNDCPHCEGDNIRERFVSVYLINKSATLVDVAKSLRRKPSHLRFKSRQGLSFAVVMLDHQ